MRPAVPEEAVVDATSFDPLGAAIVLGQLAAGQSTAIRSGLLDDIARKDGFSSSRLTPILAALCDIGVLRAAADGYAFAISADEMRMHAAVLRGFAYAAYRHRDSNEIDITLSPPADPSRLMEILPKQGFAWARLHNTKDSLIELASAARWRFVIISPFLDDEGLEWIGQLFDATAARSVQRTLIARGLDSKDAEVLRSQRPMLASKNVRILTYAITHDPTLRSIPVETFHAKILLADLDKAYIGSSNMNRWSRDFSMECGVVIRGPAAKPVATLVDALLQISEPWHA
jgi:phosphatidylserine/phosphatidylglycerophosphate/cardiolipin synthase-like enzyme